jgi:cell division protein FtsN
MNKQFGGTFLGIIIGLMLGLALALIVAVFISKVPVPFLDKDPSQQGLSDAAEAKKNQGWNPNAPLAGKNPARPASASSAATASVPAAANPVPPASEAAATKSADPIADLARAKSSASPADPFLYFIQIGAFRSAEDANAQKAKLSLLGIETKVSEREQAGRAVFRVRSGPFEQREEAEKVRERVEGASFEAVLVRVQR